MEGLFDITTILWHMLNAAILFTAVYFLLYKPVNGFLLKRAASVNAKLDEADARREEAQQLLAQGETALADARRQATDNAAVQARQAQEHADAILAAAKQQADRILQSANEEAEQIRANARDVMADESAKLAVLIAEKLLSREVTPADDLRLIGQFLENVEDRHD